MVFGREHDTEKGFWVGRRRNEGWPIFQTENIPRFESLKLEPRVALKHFEGVKKRAEAFKKEMEGVLRDCGGGVQDSASFSDNDSTSPFRVQDVEGGEEERPVEVVAVAQESRLQAKEKEIIREALNFWKNFLEQHQRTFGAMAALSFEVDAPDRACFDNLLPAEPAASASTVWDVPLVGATQYG